MLFIQLTGSPFMLKVFGPPDPTKVRVTGQGIQNGTLDGFERVFQVNTKGAGSGELTVNVRGPQGAIECFYCG